MPKCFTSWTVLPHDPIEKHTESLWSVSGKMPGGNQRRMAIARRADGRLVIHGPIALDEGEMSEVERFGKPAFLVVPNAFHRQDSLIYKQRYPDISVLCPQGSRKKISEVVEVAGHLDEMPRDAQVELFHLRGLKQREGAIRVQSGGKTALVFNDVLLNIPLRGGLAGFFMAPSGVVSVPRFARWMLIKSAAELKEHLRELASAPLLTHVVPGHGAVVESEAETAMNQAAGRL